MTIRELDAIEFEVRKRNRESRSVGSYMLVRAVAELRHFVEMDLVIGVVKWQR